MNILPNYRNQTYKPKVLVKKKLLLEKNGNEEEYWLRSGLNASMEILEDNIKFGINLLNKPQAEREILQEQRVFPINYPQHCIAGRVVYNPINFKIVETYRNDSVEFINNWIFEMTQQLAGEFFHTLKKHVKINLFQDGILCNSWILYGLFISSRNYYETGEIEIEANYDYFKNLIV